MPPHSPALLCSRAARPACQRRPQLPSCTRQPRPHPRCCSGGRHQASTGQKRLFRGGRQWSKGYTYTSYRHHARTCCVQVELEEGGDPGPSAAASEAVGRGRQPDKKTRAQRNKEQRLREEEQVLGVPRVLKRIQGPGSRVMVGVEGCVEEAPAAASTAGCAAGRWNAVQFAAASQSAQPCMHCGSQAHCCTYGRHSSCSSWLRDSGLTTPANHGPT